MEVYPGVYMPPPTMVVPYLLPVYTTLYTPWVHHCTYGAGRYMYTARTVHGDEALGSDKEKPLGGRPPCASCPQECYCWYASLRRVLYSLPVNNRIDRM